MTYSVKWISTNVSFARRFDVYLDYPFFEHQVYNTRDISLCLHYLLKVPLFMVLLSFVQHTDPLVFHIQLIHDGHLSNWSGFDDFDADT